jgi:23S rRNA (cytosine1962-C5)-methyltransferase
MKVIRLHEGKERALLRRHPWVFAGAVARGGGDSGETVRVDAADGRVLGWAAFSPNSQIRLRMWSFDPSARIDHDFFRQRLQAAIARRARLGLDMQAVRLVHGESDGMPGCIVDRYGDIVVLQVLAAGIERIKPLLVQVLRELLPEVRLYERSDAGVRALEGLQPTSGWLHGGGETRVDITENKMHMQVDVATGHKTGFYLDQRDNRAHFATLVREQRLRKVLNCYGYTGGFTLAALAGGAKQVLTVDSSAPALAQAEAHVQRNGFDSARAPMLDADVNATLRRLREEGRRFDAIVLDPPKLAPNAAAAARAARAYKDINRLALSLLEPGGWLYTFSCSGGIDAPLFQSIVAGAALDAEVEADIVARARAGADHPVLLAFPEGEYLKGLLLQTR